MGVIVPVVVDDDDDDDDDDDEDDDDDDTVSLSEFSLLELPSLFFFLLFS